jgi:hypothetical protein
MRARDNVLIVLCHNYGCFTHPLTACDENRVFLDRLQGWRVKAHHILIWDYFVNYHSYLMPTPNLERIGQDLRTYRDMGVVGMFCQGSACRGGQFEGLRQYLLARFLWNPDLDAWQESAKWLCSVYGHEAGQAILEYLVMLHRHVVQDHVHMHSFGAGQEINHELFTPEILARGRKLWDTAEKQARGSEIRRRVFAARAPEMCARLFHAGLEHHVSRGALVPRPAPDRALKNRFVRAAMQGGAACLRENDGTPEDFARNYGRSYKAIVLANAELRAVVTPELGGRIYSLQWQGSGSQIELLRAIDMTRFVNYCPYDAGYEFAVDGRWHGNGTAVAHTVLQRRKAGVRLQADLQHKLRVETTYELKDDGIAIRHRVSNRGPEPVTIAPFTHPEWNVEVFTGNAMLELRNADGTWRSMALNPEDRRERDINFAGESMPCGAWRIACPESGLVLEEAFDADAVRYCVMQFATRRGNLNLELHFAPVTLKAGDAACFATSWRLSAP